jgi:hypothetical protein
MAQSTSWTCQTRMMRVQLRRRRPPVAPVLVHPLSARMQALPGQDKEPAAQRPHPRRPLPPDTT